MSLDIEFLKILPEVIEKHEYSLHALHGILKSFKEKGMSKDSMLENLKKLRETSDLETKEDIFLELMDFVVGFCNPDSSIF